MVPLYGDFEAIAVQSGTPMTDMRVLYRPD